MMQSISKWNRFLFACLAVVLMLFSALGGHYNGYATTASYAVPVYAAPGGTPAPGGGGSKHLDDLWNTVTESTVGGDLNTSTTNMGTLVTKAQSIAKTITSILTLIAFVSLLFWVAKLALSAGNPQTRKIALTGILFSGVALALFGGAWVVVSFFWNLLS